MRDGSSGVRVEDTLTGETVDVRSSAVPCRGRQRPWAVLSQFGTTGAPPLIRAMNVLVDRPARDLALVAGAPNGRMLTAVPWAGQVLVGTHQSAAPVADTEAAPTADIVAAFLDDVNKAFPALAVSMADVRLVHWGLTPARVHGSRVNLLGDAPVVDHASTGAPGLVSVAGVKLTTARLAAARSVDTVCRVLGRPAGRCRTARRRVAVRGYRRRGRTIDRNAA